MNENKETIKLQSHKKLNLPEYTKAEEIMNSVTHGIGVIFSLLAYPSLSKKYSGNCLFYIAVYCATLFILYSVSTIYHALKPGKLKGIFRKLDHCSIFLLIAGTYTPLCTIYIRKPVAINILIGIWITALAGIIINAIDVNKFSKISLACYIIMGWSVIFIAKPAFESLDSLQTLYLITGGIFYTLGAILYVMGKKMRYMHSVWHVFVLAGSVFHFMMMW